MRDVGGRFQGSSQGLARFCEVVDQAESLGGQRHERMRWTAFPTFDPDCIERAAVRCRLEAAVAVGHDNDDLAADDYLRNPPS
ncbi:hypothetical protein ACFV8T_30825 [Streptomyces sp. NPDC059832]|uniref:hypothetical protein n=1 Tax=unclassified Streptomyces TaxID=2593676 RepID=UPI00364944B0